MAQVSFQQAVATLHGMFEHIDTDVIAAVLEATGMAYLCGLPFTPRL
jgi:hypothetical protein